LIKTNKFISAHLRIIFKEKAKKLILNGGEEEENKQTNNTSININR
jgi:hypothetical protein